MANCIAFFPWLTITAATTIGDVRLIPYQKGKSPGDIEFATQQDMDAILAAYAIRKNTPVTRATLLEIGGWRSGQDVTQEISSELFRARELIAFAAMEQRQLFRHERYSNYHTFALTVQRYAAGSAGAFSFSVRRRDYGTQHMWDAEEFAFLKPLHVEDRARLLFDPPLLDALLRADAADRAPYEAIVEFNLANTDSQDTPQHTEVVMAKSAFEFLLGIDQHADSFVGALLPMVPRFPPNQEFPCPEYPRWAQRFPLATRPLESWAREFCVLRNESGHGRRRGAAPMVWSRDAHLAFASIVFPRLVRSKLVQGGFLTLAEREQIRDEWIEAYLGYDPYVPQPRTAEYHPHEWQRIQSDGALGAMFSRHMARELEKIALSQDAGR